MRVLLAANSCRTTDGSFDALQALCEQGLAAAGANSQCPTQLLARDAPTCNAPVGLFDLFMDASQASRCGPEGQ